jgi:SAM-dependent methyltransferase
MAKLQDQNYLQEEQYHTEAMLRTRISLHEQFSINKFGWFNWVFDQFPLNPDLRILELGCGPGDLWLGNVDRIPVSWQISLSDLSLGMVNQARLNLGKRSQQFSFHTIDAQSIPFNDEYFHMVIANHCLYHVPDLQIAFSEIYRVLRKGGQLYAATIGEEHLKEISELILDFDPTLEDVFQSDERPFTLENGYSTLQERFTSVEVKRYPDALHITESQPLVDYILSIVLTEKGSGRKEKLTGFISAQMKNDGGVIIVKKDSGLYAATKALV